MKYPIFFSTAHGNAVGKFEKENPETFILDELHRDMHTKQK